jgi:hypothetical protein
MRAHCRGGLVNRWSGLLKFGGDRGQNTNQRGTTIILYCCCCSIESIESIEFIESIYKTSWPSIQVEEASRRLVAAGFQHITEKGAWDVQPGGKWV